MDKSSIKDRIRASFLNHRRLINVFLLLCILLLGGFLRFYQLGMAGIGNTYYAAAVKSMLTSWKDFFFVAFEPGGSLSLDKPPLGFWVEALSAYFLGVNGFALALPNALAGLFSIFLIYKLVRRPFGEWAGLAAALALAVTPVVVATERNNTIDGLLVFVLLLAAWAFLQSVYTSKARWLYLGVFMVGLGFNIKMLQALLPLPAFYALYLFGAKHKWGKKILHLVIATALLLVVSFSWAIMVDSVPSSERPYVDSTSNNTVMELIFGHNGIERLIRIRQGMGLDDRQNRPPIQGNLSSAQIPRQFPNGQPPQVPAAGQDFRRYDGPPAANNRMGQPGSMDFGTPGTLRLFTQPLVGEASWLLPFVLCGLVVLAIVLWKKPIGEKHLSVILWAGWLLPEAIYFTYSQGLMHAYYLIMMGAPIAALAGMTTWGLWQMMQKHRISGLIISALLFGGTLAFQAYTFRVYLSVGIWVTTLAGLLFCLGLAAAMACKRKEWLSGLALGVLLVAIIVAPTAWSILTTLNSSANEALPHAGPAQQGRPVMMMGQPNSPTDNLGMMQRGSNSMWNGNQDLLKFLLANTEPGTYLLATDRANDAAPYILATGRPVLTLGGFLGQYTEVSVEQLSGLVEKGQLRFITSQGLQRHQEIYQWVQKNCRMVNEPFLSVTGGFDARNPSGRGGNGGLYDCRK